MSAPTDSGNPPSFSQPSQHQGHGSKPLPPQAPRAQRVLSCVLCQQRKVRCDRSFPCANCVRHKARCVPATQVRQRRRRFPERELLDRLRQYEGLLRRNGVKFEPLHKASAAGKAPVRDCEDDNDNDEGDSDADAPPASAADGSSPWTAAQPEGAFEVRSIWQAMTQETQASTNSSDAPVASMVQSTVKSALDELGHDDDLLFGNQHQTLIDLSTLHPDAVDIFRLWQVYLENADPLFKVTHNPSLQRRIIAAAKNLASIERSLEALMFSIYSLATFSLTEEDCLDMFGLAKDDLQARYRFGCQQALMNARYLRSADRDCLTAFYLYLLSARLDSDPRSTSSMLAVALRIAQGMGIHKESCLSQLPPFEAEMRRRLWWAIMLYDSRLGEKTDLKDVPLSPTWDCKIPLNVDDSDLRGDMKELPKAKATSTQMLYVVVRCEIADFVRNASFHLDFTNPTLKPLARVLPDGGSLEDLERRIEHRHFAACDPENPIHFVTVWMTRTYIAKCRLLEHYSRGSGSQQADKQRDHAMSLALNLLESDTKMMTSPLVSGFLWHLQSYFPFPAYMHILQDLRQRPLSALATQAWDVLSDSCEARFPPPKPVANPLFIMFGKLVLGAWEAFEAVSESAEPRSVPRLVSSTRERDAARAQMMQCSVADGPGEVAYMSANGWFAAAPTGVEAEAFMMSTATHGDLEEVDPFTGLSSDASYPLNPGSYHI
ncbi:hypothetical protein JDV02_010398 [Purpureocillium takamizusanense]|uniref:Zn(2)-C6 fungal-type domain-containing protein n=1 Tax=Purpureocillium takamizusanense TaxID=2060973 RepID=A0A9Q8QUE2_9HYPO|nr:uncharacterized protein JDV02_010398 [Purpureocillium takamizusanense]UNI24667.1 hypothetical protein JDV02_010398 [Purpureocillium takamizusanense]